MNLEDKRRELARLEKELADLKNGSKKDDGNSLKFQIYLTSGRINKLTGEIAILEKMVALENKYRNKEPINFYYNNGSYGQNLVFKADNVNYEKAYEQQKKLLGLELTHYRAMPISGVNYDEPDYEKLYNQNRNVLLDMHIDLGSNVLGSSVKVDDEKKTPAHLKTGISVKDSSAAPTGKHFKKIDGDPAENQVISNPSIGTKYFKLNELSLPYAIFIKDGFGYIVGNFTSDYVRNNYELLDSKLLDENLKGVKLINDLDVGKNNVQGLDVKINVSKYGNIDIVGDVDAVQYYNQIDDEKVQDNEKLQDDEIDLGGNDDSNTVSMQDDKDMSGLDVMPDMPDLSHGAEEIEPVIRGRLVKSNKSKPSLIEKFKNLKTWQKAVIIGGVIAVAGVGVFVVGPHIMEAINNLANPEHVNTANNVINSVNDTVTNATSSAALDYGSIGEGHTVFTNAYDAANNANGVVSNEWFSNNPLDVFNTATNSYMGLTPEQLNDPAFMAELAKDPNNAMLLGNSMTDPSGFVSLDDVVNTVTKTR